MAGRYDFTTEAGILWEFGAVWKDANGSPVATPGYTASFQAWAPGGTAPSIASGTANVTAALSSAGSVAVSVPPAVSSALGGATMTYELVISDAGGTPVKRLLEGLVTFTGWDGSDA